MKILRLFSKMPTGDQTVCYVSRNTEGMSCVNGEPEPVTFNSAGDGARSSSAMTLTLPAGTVINDEYFLSCGDEGALLRWNAEAACFSVVTPGFLSVSDRVEIWAPVRTAVLTVSDKGSRGEREDTAGPELERLAMAYGCEAADRRIVPDDPEMIQAAVKGWCGEGYNLVLTTGGTGTSPRDITPEALLGIADKIVPGFGEVMRAGTMKYTPRAFLTRGLAVIADNTLVIAFPGSRRGASQCFEAIAGGLRHAVETLMGLSSECGGK